IICERGGDPDVAKLADFGLVRESRPEDAKLTQTGTIVGSPLYMSPEQIAGSEQLDARSDLYSLGLVAYFALSGGNPFLRANLRPISDAHLADAAPPLYRVCPHVDLDLSEVVMRCLAKEPAARFSDAASLEQSLGRCACAGQWTRELAEAW